jgi:hypothetical protein
VVVLDAGADAGQSVVDGVSSVVLLEIGKDEMMRKAEEAGVEVDGELILQLGGARLDDDDDIIGAGQSRAWQGFSWRLAVREWLPMRFEGVRIRVASADDGVTDEGDDEQQRRQLEKSLAAGETNEEAHLEGVWASIGLRRRRRRT